MEACPAALRHDVTAPKRRRREEAAINTQGVCAYLSRTKKSENGINALTMGMADTLPLKLLLFVFLFNHIQGEWATPLTDNPPI